MSNFTPQQIEEFLQEFFDVVGTRQYVGARYVPLFGRRGEESIVWDDSAPYEPLTIVTYQGDSYTSRQYVPAQVDISDEQYWAKTGNFNAQIEQYRAEVLAIQDSFTEFQADMTQDFNEAEAQLQSNYDATVDQLNQDFQAAVDGLDEAVQDIRDEVFATKYMVVIGDSFSADTQSGTPLWYTYVARQLGLTPYSNAHDGRGYGAYLGHTTYTFQQQAQQAANELPHDAVKLIYVVGGLNDTRNASFNTTQFAQGVSNVLNILTTNFTNAKIEVYGPQSFPQINANTRQAAIWLAWTCSNYGVEYHDLSAKFNAYPEFFGGNGGAGTQNSMHPSARGEKTIAQAIMSHGVLPQPSYRPTTLPQDLATPPIMAQLWANIDSAWVLQPDTALIDERLVTPDGVSFEWCIGIVANQVANTATMLQLTLPFGFGYVLPDFTLADICGEFSQITQNVAYTGWLEAGSGAIATFGAPGIRTFVNGTRPLQTGAGAGNIRFRLQFSQRG